jgi:hypothetical protein
VAFVAPLDQQWAHAFFKKIGFRLCRAQPTRLKQEAQTY